jgi:mono/diheme cytochrome c family protein
MRRQHLRGLLIVSLLGLWRGVVYAQEDEIIAGGKLKYDKYCATCHGPKAKGDGPSAAILTIKPADLTQLSKRHNGQFPFWRAYRMIDGREEVRGHGTRAMPLWGLIFQVEEGAAKGPYQTDLVRGRVWQLVYFLESIQE